MSATAVVVILYVNILESLAIFSGNMFTIVVFWRHRNKLKQTSFLLINLAVADLLVGLVEAVVISTQHIPRALEKRSNSHTHDRFILAAFQTTFTFASVFFLVLISLERAYALVWPLRHRVASMKGYIYIAVFV